jgi:hypothetical protein
MRGDTGRTWKTVLTGLVPGKKSWLRVTIIGVKKQSITCEPVLSKMIQYVCFVTRRKPLGEAAFLFLYCKK